MKLKKIIELNEEDVKEIIANWLIAHEEFDTTKDNIKITSSPRYGYRDVVEGYTITITATSK